LNSHVSSVAVFKEEKSATACLLHVSPRLLLGANTRSRHDTLHLGLGRITAFVIAALVAITTAKHFCSKDMPFERDSKESNCTCLMIL
jgi:hypothetical protein